MSQPQAVVYIVEDDEAVRSSLALLLSLQGLRTMVFASAEQFLQTFRAELPGCLVLDLRMHGMSGLDLLAELQRRGASLPVIVITAHGDVANTRASFKFGAVDFFEKPVDHDALVAAIRAALDRDAEQRRTEEEEAALTRRLELLSGREREVLDLVATGLHNREIAAQLDISPRTVEVYKARLMDKLGVRRLPDLIRLALRRGSKAATRGA
jgi:RNA polymerase sigma factor (sigma-70 family)